MGATAAPAHQAAPAARCYGLRRVNPFLGVVALVKTDDARALSIDGVNWQVQILAHPPRGLWSGDGDSDQLQYFRFGVWSQAEGLRRVPLNPILDLNHMLAASEALCGQIAAHQGQAPFTLGPELEQWLLDADGAPLALLATVLDAPGLEPGEARADRRHRLDWRCPRRACLRLADTDLAPVPTTTTDWPTSRPWNG